MYTGKHGFKKIESSDYYSDFPQVYNSNLDLMLELLEKLYAEVEELRQHVKQLERESWD